MAPSCQDEWYQEIDKRYYCLIYATRRIFCYTQEEHGCPVAFLPMESALVAGCLGDSAFRDTGGPGAVPHVGRFW